MERGDDAAGAAAPVAATAPLLLAFGANAFHQLGLLSSEDITFPSVVRRLSELQSPPVVCVSASLEHTVVVTADGVVRTCGSNERGQLARGDGGDGDLEVVSALDACTVVTAAAGGGFTLAATADGRVFAWGDVSSLRLPGAPPGGVARRPVAVRQLAGVALGGPRPPFRVVSLAAGRRHACLLTDTGAVFVCRASAGPSVALAGRPVIQVGGDGRRRGCGVGGVPRLTCFEPITLTLTLTLIRLRLVRRTAYSSLRVASCVLRA